MAEKIEFDLVAPEQLLFAEQVDMVVVPGGDGDFGVLPRHAPMIATVRPGVITVYEGGTGNRRPTERIFVAGGFAEVTPERVTVLAEQAIRVADIDRAKAQQEANDAREDIADAKDAAEKAAAGRRLTVAEAKVQAAGG